MPKLRHLAEALGPQSDYSYDKQFKHGAGTRASRQRHSRIVSKLARRATKRETERIVASER